jgi:hypothetical protein
MRRNVVIGVVAVAGFLVGVACASWYWLDFNAAFMTSGLVTRTQADIVTKVHVLEHLRSGRTEEAERNLEILLDGDLIGAAALAREGHTFSQKTRDAVTLEFRARQLGAYTPDPAIQSSVAEAFRLLTQAPNKPLEPTR